MRSMVLVALGLGLVFLALGCGTPIGGGAYVPQPSPYIVAADDADFDEVVLASEKLVVVDFWASWCGPCARLDPTVVKLAEEFQDRVQFVRINVNESPTSASEYVGSGIPTLAMFSAGEFVDARVGVEPENALRGWLLDHLDAVEDES